MIYQPFCPRLKTSNSSKGLLKISLLQLSRMGAWMTISYIISITLAMNWQASLILILAFLWTFSWVLQMHPRKHITLVAMLFSCAIWTLGFCPTMCEKACCWLNRCCCCLQQYVHKAMPHIHQAICPALILQHMWRGSIWCGPGCAY